jgi:hypothetical protein
MGSADNFFVVVKGLFKIVESAVKRKINCHLNALLVSSFLSSFFFPFFLLLPLLFSSGKLKFARLTPPKLSQNRSGLNGVTKQIIIYFEIDLK